VAFKKLAFIFSDIVALMCSLLFLNDLVLPLGTTLTYATSSSALTRPRSSGTLSRRGEGCAAREGQGIESLSPLPSRERVARSRGFHQPGRAG